MKLVRNERKNFINIRIKRNYIPMIHHHKGPSRTVYHFFATVKFEPFVSVVPIHPDRGIVDNWSAVNIEELLAAIANFKVRRVQYADVF